MNGPLKMYQMRQIVRHDVPVELPSCMYKLNNVHAPQAQRSPSPPTIAHQSNQHLPEMTALVQRQETILRQLEELRLQMTAIKNSLCPATPPPVAKGATVASPSSQQVHPNGLAEIVLNVNPCNPPYSLHIVQKLWRDQVHVKVQTYQHSTINALPSEAHVLTNLLESHQSQANTPTLHVKLIWKDVGRNLELMLSRTTIFGEVNLLRYLASVGPANFAYQSAANYYDFEAMLDLSHALIAAKNKTQRKVLLVTMFKRLGKSQWFCGGNEVSIADIAAYSAIKQTAESEINQTMGKWMQRCEHLLLM